MSVELLASIDLFSFLTQDQLHTLDRSSRTVGLPAGDLLFSEGDEGAEVFIVVEGLMRIHRAIAVGADRTLAELGPGAMFGEASIIDRDLRSASATAVVETQLLVLDADHLQSFMLETPDVGLLIMGRLAAMMMERLRTTNDRLKDSLSWGLEVSGAAQISMRHLVSSGAEVDLHLRDGRDLRGRLVRSDTDAGALTLWVRTDDDRLHLVPFHAVNELVCGVGAGMED